VSDVTTSVAHFISLEVMRRSGVFRCGPFPAGGHRALVTVIGMEVVIDVTVKVGGTMKPRASPDKDTAGKPFGPVVAIGCTTVGSGVIVAVGTIGSDADVDVDLRLCSGSTGCKAKTGGCGQCKHFQSTHKFHLMLVREAFHLAELCCETNVQREILRNGCLRKRKTIFTVWKDLL
jgi:hypothetical protein